MSWIGVIGALVLVLTNAAPAVQGAEYYLATDVPAILGGSNFTTNQIVLSNNADYTLQMTLPAGVELGAIDWRCDGTWLFSPDFPVNLNGTEFEPRDVFSYDGASFAMFIDGSSEGIPNYARIDALFLDSASGNPVLSFDVPVTLGTTTYSQSDLVVRTAPGAFTLFWNAAAAGVPSYANVVGADQDESGNIVMSFDVPANVAGTEFLPGQLVQRTGSGLASYFLDPSWPPSAQLRDFSFVRIDDTPPQIHCPSPQTLLGDSNCNAVPPAATATDECDPEPSITSSPSVLAGPGSVSVTYTATDSRGNRSSCSTTFEITQCPCVARPAGMVGWWPFDEVPGAGVKAIDFVQANDGDILGSVTHASGEVGGAFGFGATGHVRVVDPTDGSLDFGASQAGTENGDFSIDAWIRVPSTCAGGTAPGTSCMVNTDCPGGGSCVPGNLCAEIVGKHDRNRYVPGYSLSLDLDCNPTARFGMVLTLNDDTSDWSYLTTEDSVVSLRDGGWHHFAVSVDRDTSDGVTFYLDGAILALYGSAPASPPGSLSNNLDFVMGPRGLALDEVEVFKRVLSAAEIQGIYQAGNFGKCKCNLNACADTDPCTSDRCDPFVLGQCNHFPVTCTDGNGCTLDSCEPATGACSHAWMDWIPGCATAKIPPGKGTWKPVIQ